MSTPIINFGTYIDNHKEMNIQNISADDAPKVIKTFFEQEEKHQSNVQFEDIETVQEEPQSSSIPPGFFCVSQRFTEQNIRERLDAELQQASTKRDYCRGLYRLQHMGCIDIDQYASDAQRAHIFNLYQNKYRLDPNDFCRARASM